MLCLALSTDAAGFPYNATLIASILRRTASALHVRCWCRGFRPESFETGLLRVEFIEANQQVTGKYPSYVGPAVFDRLRVIEQAEDWDRCLIMDYDQVALCDLAPLFGMDLGDHLLAARMQGAGVDMAHAMREWLRRPLPEGWEHVAGYPYFSMGPLLNLKAMREAGTWEKLLAAHEAFGADEQLSLTAATEGRTVGFERKWNLFPKSDIPESTVPQGVVHWLGWPKPWHRGAKVWRPDIWESERSSWEHLRMGMWEKPVAVEVEPEDGRGVRGLLERGWKVRVLREWSGAGVPDMDGENAAAGGRRHNTRQAEAAGGVDPPSSHREQVGSMDGHPDALGVAPFPDLEVGAASPAALEALLAAGAPPVDLVRFGQWIDVPEWIARMQRLPPHLVLRGSMPAGEVDWVVRAGYDGQFRLKACEWPAGGPLPRVLAHGAPESGQPLAPGEDIYLRTANCRRLDSTDRVPERERIRHPEARRIGVAVVATGGYRAFVGAVVRSIRRNFLPGHEVRVFLLTDADFRSAPDVVPIRVEHRPWPEMTLGRHALVASHRAAFAGLDFLFYLDADMRVVGEVGDEILGDLVAVVHPGYHDQDRSRLPFESRPASAACVRAGEGATYYCGAFQGGKADHFLAVCESLAAMVEADRARGVTAVWHDESHWNRYLIDHPPSVALSPSYCRYTDGRSAGFEPRIDIVPKDARTLRAR